uniref:NusG-like N-terminal domain-containing protein n=1 Tax=Schlesneria paludicola TaxID=360056 RepID=A0A7C2P275_9PLAN
MGSRPFLHFGSSGKTPRRRHGGHESYMMKGGQLAPPTDDSRPLESGRMPFAAPIPAIWPEHIWDGRALTAPDSTAWYALKVRPRCEKQVAKELMDCAVAYCLSLRTTPRIYQRRRVETQVPLFPGYVFAAGTEEQISVLWRLRNVSATLAPPSQDEFVQELSGVCRLMMSGAPLTREARLLPGERARITHGSLKGLEGTVLRNSDGIRLIVGVTWMGQGVSVAVTADMLERVWSPDPLGARPGIRG